MIELYGHFFKYCPEWKKFLIYQNGRWKLDDKEEIYLYAKLAINDIFREASELSEDPEGQTKIAKWATRSLNRYALQGMVFMARNEPEIAVIPEQFDRDPYLFNCLNKTVNLRTME